MELQIFENAEFGSIRTFMIDGEPWFVGKDVAEQLGYQQPRNAIATHVDIDDKTTAQIQCHGSNYKTRAFLINESGLYSLVCSSQLESAKKFKRWITKEVLPSLRKTGMYLTEEAQNVIEYKDELTSVRDTAKILKMHPSNFTYLICDLGYVYRKNNVIVPYSFMINNGYAVFNEFYKNGNRQLTTTFTRDGRAYLYRQFKERFDLK